MGIINTLLFVLYPVSQYFKFAKEKNTSMLIFFD